MSQSKETFNAESEDIFTTQDLAQDGPSASTDDDCTEDIVPNSINDYEPQLNGENVEVSETVAEGIEDFEEDSDGIQMETNSEEPSEKSKSKPTKISRDDRCTEFPLAKIAHIIKLDPEVKLVSKEAVFLITKATELFAKSLARESFAFAAQQKKKTVTKSHVDQALTMLPIEL